MALSFPFQCPLPNGIHARPASALEEVARNFSADVSLKNQRTGRDANAKSILSLVAAGICFNDACLLKVTGVDEQVALAALSLFIRTSFPHCDDAVAESQTTNGKPHLPRSLCGSGATIRPGTVVVPGIAQGRLVWATGFRIPEGLATQGVSDLPAEHAKMEQALQRLLAWYSKQLAGIPRGIEQGLLAAQRAIVRDEQLRQLLFESLARQRTAAGAIADAAQHFSAMLESSDNPLLHERVLDIQDVCSHLLQEIYGSANGLPRTVLTHDAVVVAEVLTPGQFLALDRRFLKGLVLAEAGTTSHTMILARSFGIPTLVGVEGLTGATFGDQEAVLDADAGALVMNLTDHTRQYYESEERRRVGRDRVLQQFSARPAATADGHRLELGANIATVAEAPGAFVAGAEGIGLFRTEMLFVDRDAPPDETEQFDSYVQVLQAAGRQPVLFRTLDIGGDKPLPYLNLPPEQNPFLGCRAVRLYPDLEPLFRTQVRAIVRASAHGLAKLMLPMVSTVEEVRWAKRIIAEEQSRCTNQAEAFDPIMPIGAMIEVPAAAFAMEGLSRELDFFSIGSNDLLQYFMAVDRANARVAGLYNPLQPAFLRLLKQISDTAHAHKKWVGLCGELGGQAKFLPLLVGLNLDEISAPVPALAELKAELAPLELKKCQQLLSSACQCATAEEVGALLNKFSARQNAPLLAPELILYDALAPSKAAAIKYAIDQLYIRGRTMQPRLVEEAVWEREASCSTGFGHGFAIPHCKSDAVRTNSLVLLKLRQPVEWASLDGEPVRVVILLAVRASDAATEHMRVFSKLARQLMHNDFRTRLEQETNEAELCTFLQQRLAG